MKNNYVSQMLAYELEFHCIQYVISGHLWVHPISAGSVGCMYEEDCLGTLWVPGIR